MDVKATALRGVLMPLSCLAVMGNAAAQTGDSATPDGDEIVVTAEKRATNLQDTPIAVSVLSGDDVARSGISGMSGLNDRVPNLDIAGDVSTPNATRVTLRGIGAQNVTLNGEAGVAFHQDGIYYARPQGANASFFDIERVEVLRGPQGTLYGRNATGGTVNIISKRPKMNEFGGEATLSYGNYDAFVGGLALNVPVLTDVMAVRASVFRDRHDGYTRNVADNDLPNLDDADDLSMRLQLLVEPSDRLSLLLRGNYFRRGGAGSAAKLIADAAVLPDGKPNPGAGDRNPDYVMVPGVGFGKIPRPGNYDLGYYQRNGLIPISDDPWEVAYDFPSRIRNTQKTLSAELNWDAGPARLTMLGAIIEDSIFQHYDSDYTNVAAGTKYFRGKTRQRTFEMRLSSPSASRLYWVAGAYYFDEENRPSGGPLSDNFGGLQVLNVHYPPLENLIGPGVVLPSEFSGPIVVGQRVDNASLSLFGQMTYPLTDSLNITGGLRWNRDRKFARRVNFNNFAIPAAALTNDSNRATFEKVTWKLGFDWKVGPDAMIYSSVSTGFKPGGISFTAVDKPYGAETITAYEVGAKTEWLDRRLQLNLSAFYYDYSGLQVSQLMPDLVGFIIVNAARAEVKGLELEWQARITPQFRLSGSAAYLDATFKDYRDAPYDPYLASSLTPQTVDLSGARMPNAARFTASGGFDHKLELAHGGTITSTARLSYQGSMYLQQYTVAHYRRAPYAKLDMLLTYTAPGGAWSITGFVNNLTGSKVIKAVESMGTNLGNGLAARYAAPRTYGLRASLAF